LNNPDDKQKRARQMGAYVTIPFVLAVPPVLGWFVGSWLDGKIGTDPYLMYLFLLLGFVAGFRELYRIIKKFGNGA
jgi:ATP synthase protein I